MMTSQAKSARSRMAEPGVRSGRMPKDENAQIGAQVPFRLTRTTDESGRLNLGKDYANVTFIVRPGRDDTEIVLTQGRVIPEREIWLFNNPEAQASIARGLAQAKAGETANPPDLDADLAEFGEEDE